MMRLRCGTILAATVAAVATAAPLAEYPGEVGEKTGWKCVGSEEGKVVYIPFEGYYESKGRRIESPRFKLDGEIGKNRFYRLTFSAKCPVDGYWWVDFFDAEGNQLPDVNSRLYASDDWTPYDVMVPARPDAAFAQIAFVTKKGAQAKDVSMRQASVAFCAALALVLCAAVAFPCVGSSTFGAFAVPIVFGLPVMLAAHCLKEA